MFKRWRVGSLSMGIILVASGVMLMVSLITRVNASNILLSFWPVILVCLGLEILLHLFIKRDADVIIKYDVLSVIFIGFVLFVSALFYIATFSMNLLGEREDVYDILGIRFQDAYIESGAEFAGANDLVILDGHMSLKAVQSAGGAIRAEYRVSAQTNDPEYAASMLEKIIQTEQGERAYMLINTSIIHNNRKLGYPAIDCVIYLPPGKTLVLSQFYGDLTYDPALEEQIIRW